MKDQTFNYGHVSVLKKELVEFLSLKSGDCVIDATLGLGGHAEEVLKVIGKRGKLIGIDLDEANLKIARDRLGKYQDQICFFHGSFDNLDNAVLEAGLTSIDKIYFDLGLSSPQIDEPDKGFSFLKAGPLDMRFDRSEQSLTSEDIVNEYSKEELTKIFKEYGEEKFGWKLAEEIVRSRKLKRIVGTSELVELIEKVIFKKQKGKHPATKIFQALRIEVNDELNVLERALEKSFKILKTGGRLVVISYHSLEDRIVKNYFKHLVETCVCPKEKPVCDCGKQKEAIIITKKPIIPTQSEIEKNSRSRSAKLRVVEKLI